MSVTSTATLNINATQATQTLQRLDKQLQGLSSGFGRLKNALGGIAFAGLITNSLKFADSIQDIAQATGLATESVLGFSQAVQQNGGTIESANNSLIKFTTSIGEAAEGNKGLQEAFRKVGVSLQDLETLSEKDLLQKTLNGLSSIEDAAKRATLQNQLLGKSFKGVNVKGVASSFGVATVESVKYAQSVNKAAELNDKLTKAVDTFRLELLKALEPFINFLNAIDTSSESFQRAANAIKALAAAIGLLLVFIPVVRAISAAAAAIRLLQVGLKGLNKISIKDVFAAAISKKSYTEAVKRLGKLRDIIRKNDTKKLTERNIKQGKDPIVAEQEARQKAIENSNRVFEKFKGRLDDARESARNLLTTLTAVGGVVLSGITGFFQDVEEPIKPAPMPPYRTGGSPNPRRMSQETKDQIRRQREIVDAFEAERKSINATAASYKLQSDRRLEDLRLGYKQLTMTDDAIELQNALIDIQRQNKDAILQLRDAQSKLAKDDPLYATYDNAIAAIRKLLPIEAEATTQIIQGTQKQRREQENLRKAIEDTVAAFETSMAIEELQEQLTLIGLEDEALERQQTLLAANAEMRTKLLALAQQMANVELEKDKLGQIAYDAEKQRIQNQILDAYRLRDAKIEAKEQELDAIKKLEEDYNAGVKRATEDSRKEWTKTNTAYKATQSVIGNLESAMDNFVNTGKLKFSDLARSILADLAKIAIKAALNPIFNAIGAGIGNWVGSIFGGFMAKGGPVKGNTPYIVGEKGPELFVPQGSGSIVPNNKLGNANGAVASQAAGPITNNYNTYNINALDAKSVAQLFAENRKAIFGANKMAEREMSYVGVR